MDIIIIIIASLVWGHIVVSIYTILTAEDTTEEL